MIKIIIGLVAVVLLALGAYLYTHSPESAEKRVSQKREHALPKSHEAGKALAKEETAKKDVLIHAGSYQKKGKQNTLTKNQLKKIEAEVNGKSSLYLTDEQVEKIEAEVNGKGSIDLSDEQIARIEAEIEHPKATVLTQTQVKSIESEVNSKGETMLSKQDITKIENEVKATLQ